MVEKYTTFVTADYTNRGSRNRATSDREAFGGGSVTVWDGIMANGKANLVVLLKENISDIVYKDVGARNIVIPCAENVGNDFVYVDEKALPHRARIITEVFKEHYIERIDWPAKRKE